MYADLGLTWEDVRKGKFPIIETTETTINGVKVNVYENGVKQPLLFQAFIKGFENWIKP